MTSGPWQAKPDPQTWYLKAHLHSSECTTAAPGQGSYPWRAGGSEGRGAAGTRAPKGDGAVVGDLDAVEAHNDIIRQQVLGGVAQRQHGAHQHALLPVVHFVRPSASGVSSMFRNM